jgi:hypothetical protein
MWNDTRNCSERETDARATDAETDAEQTNTVIAKESSMSDRMSVNEYQLTIAKSMTGRWGGAYIYCVVRTVDSCSKHGSETEPALEASPRHLSLVSLVDRAFRHAS